MPAAFTHYKLGNDVYKLLPVKIQNDILQYKDLFDIGLQGPDILLYYKPLTTNASSLLGFDMHDKPAREFFEKSKDVFTRQINTSAGMAYMYGFVCHFALDSLCHPYVEEKIKQSGISHTEIEAEFDRELMKKAGFNPISFKPVDYMNITSANAATIARFFPTIKKEQIMEALASMKRYGNLLVAPNILKRLFLYGVLKFTNNYEEMHGLIINYRANPKCYDSCARLEELYHEAIELSVFLIKEYKEYIIGNKELNDRYERTFSIK